MNNCKVTGLKANVYFIHSPPVFSNPRPIYLPKSPENLECYLLKRTSCKNCAFKHSGQ